MSGFIDSSSAILIFFILISAPILAIIDLRQREFNGAWRVYWALIIVLMPIAGSVLYGLLGHRTFAYQ